MGRGGSHTCPVQRPNGCMHTLVQFVHRPPDRSRPKQRRRCPAVVRKAMRAVRWTTFGASVGRWRGMTRLCRAVVTMHCCLLRH
jgi:hypothetical protein